MRVRASRSVLCILLITQTASADFVGVTTVNKDDPQTTWYVDDDCPEICLGTVVTCASGCSTSTAAPRRRGEGLDTVIDGFMIAGAPTSCRHREGTIPKDNTFW